MTIYVKWMRPTHKKHHLKITWSAMKRKVHVLRSGELQKYQLTYMSLNENSTSNEGSL